MTINQQKSTEILDTATLIAVQEKQNEIFRLKKKERLLDIRDEKSLKVHSSSFKQLDAIYKSPSYQIIRGFRRLNWKLRGRPKKPYYRPLSEDQCKNEIIRILNSPLWNFLGIIHACYLLLFKRK